MVSVTPVLPISSHPCFALSFNSKPHRCHATLSLITQTKLNWQIQFSGGGRDGRGGGGGGGGGGGSEEDDEFYFQGKMQMMTPRSPNLLESFYSVIDLVGIVAWPVGILELTTGCISRFLEFLIPLPDANPKKVRERSRVVDKSGKEVSGSKMA